VIGGRRPVCAMTGRRPNPPGCLARAAKNEPARVAIHLSASCAVLGCACDRALVRVRNRAMNLSSISGIDPLREVDVAFL
jgi:hypothetical protein